MVCWLLENKNMKYVVLIEGCYLFITLIIMGITTLFDSEFLYNLTHMLWWCSPVIFFIGIFIAFLL